jgi:hypothetical protein
MRIDVEPHNAWCARFDAALAGLGAAARRVKRGV